jgi:hypothetical protein
MNLTNDEANKVIEALKLAESMASIFDQLSQKLGDLRERQTDRSRLEEITEALAILQAAKVRPQPAVDKLIEAGDAMRERLLDITEGNINDGRVMPAYNAQTFKIAVAWTAAKSAAPVEIIAGDLRGIAKAFHDAGIDEVVHPQPAVDTMMDAMLDELELLGSLIRAERSNPSIASRECTDEQLERVYVLRDQLATKSAAPVDPPKVLTEEVIEKLRLSREREDGRPASSKYSKGFEHGLRYARDNGYLAPQVAPKVLTDHEAIRLAEQASQDIGTQAAIVGALKYARDNGYLTPVKLFNA